MVLKQAGIIIIIALLGVFALKAYSNGKDILDDKFAEEPFKTTTNGLLAAVAMGLTVPSSVIGEYYGNAQESTYMLEEVPWFDSMDLFPLIIWAYVALFLIRNTWNSFTPGSAVLIIIGIVFLGTISVWVLWKLLAYYIMINRGHAIGLTTEQILNVRSSIVSDSATTRNALIASSVLGAVGVLSSWFGKN